MKVWAESTRVKDKEENNLIAAYNNGKIKGVINGKREIIEKWMGEGEKIAGDSKSEESDEFSMGNLEEEGGLKQLGIGYI